MRKWKPKTGATDDQAGVARDEEVETEDRSH
jgi:hypothetical protein